MDWEIRRYSPYQGAKSHVLDDHRIGTGSDDRAKILLGFREFILKNQCVERDIAPDAAAMQVIKKIG